MYFFIIYLLFRQNKGVDGGNQLWLRLSYFLLFPPFIRGPLGGQERASPSQEEGGGPVLGGRLASAGHAGRKTRLSILLQQFSY